MYIFCFSVLEYFLFVFEVFGGSESILDAKKERFIVSGVR